MVDITEWVCTDNGVTARTGLPERSSDDGQPTQRERLQQKDPRRRYRDKRKETIYMKWPEFDLEVGDVLEVRIFPRG
jgi:hypothetical protein